LNIAIQPVKIHQNHRKETLNQRLQPALDAALKPEAWSAQQDFPRRVAHAVVADARDWSFEPEHMTLSGRAAGRAFQRRLSIKALNDDSLFLPLA
jgi:hypothetical protein